MERQRICKISIWAYLWRLVVFCAAIFFIFSAKDAGNGGMLSFLAEWLFRGLGIFLFVLLGVFAKLGTVLESDGTFLYAVNVYYFKKLTFWTIKIEDITKMVFVGDRAVTVIILYQDKEYCLNVRKNDRAYKYLLALANVRGINQQDDEISEKTKQSQINSRTVKILLCLAVAVLIWFYRTDLLFYIMVLGMFFTIH